MNLLEVIPASRVSIIDSAPSKKSALEQISRQLSDNNEERQRRILDALVSRERLGSTGLGGGVAIPHGRISGIDQPMGCLIKLNEAIDFEASDDQPVTLMAGLVVPADCTEEHLKVLAEVARLFSQDNFIEQAQKCRDEAQLAKLLENTLAA